jgi:hypothetical protein
MSIRDEPYYQISTNELATWLEMQGIDRWWGVDGDPILAERVNLPAPADELASELRRLRKTLYLADGSVQRAGKGDWIDAATLSRLTADFGRGKSPPEQRPNWLADGELELRWADSNTDEAWILYEDEETSESYRHVSQTLQNNEG